MKRTLSTLAALIVPGMLALALLPVSVKAQQPQTETVTAQVNVTAPTGVSILGTVVANRTCGDPVTTAWSFNGTVNGARVTFSGSATERWLGNSSETIEITSVDTPLPVAIPPSVRTLRVAQAGPGLVTVNGVPVAVDVPIQEPCSGQVAYVITNPGQGPAVITQLPNTNAGGAAAGRPLIIAGLLIGAGMLLIRLGLRAPARQRQQAHEGS